MRQVLFIAFLALGPALADQTHVAPAIYAETAAANAGHAIARASSASPVLPVDSDLTEARLARLCGSRS